MTKMSMIEIWLKIRNFLVVIAAVGGVSGTGYQTMTVSEERTAYNESVSVVIHEYTELLTHQKEFYREHIKMLQEMLRTAQLRDEIRRDGLSEMEDSRGEESVIPEIKDGNIDLLYDIPDFPMKASK